ncbi:ABC transporter permease subunit [Gleimia sp. 6138-11-ORH1]|uniref:ABC transporter permease n=1 Tax=Gleimia sp. 6138-11-ORH1 TaxID=2973937 RepID=UPI002169D0CF|nr:ABC transporter permease subunit [Gleimia sp. 6138-11-ORH1]MCS4485262.1 ABC transporter permease subunit [Gleimia sp. 6138-11-ORH1]
MSWLANNYQHVINLLWMHLLLVIPAIIATLLVSVPAGYVATKTPRLRELLLTGSGLIYSIPALPLLILLPVLLGIPLRSNLNVQIGLTLYGCSLLIRAAADAFDQVDRQILSAAQALGMGKHTIFWKVHLPLAGPAILAGLRVVAVSTIALATIGALLGISSLGLLFTDGLQRSIMASVITGIVMTVILAVLIDLLLVGIGRLLMPFPQAKTHKSGQLSKPVVVA